MKEIKKGKITIVVSKNYRELYEDNLALLNHLLLDSVKGDNDWIKGVQENNLNITLYTDKNDTELFRKSFDKFEVKLMDTEVSTSPLGKEGIVRKEELVSGWYKTSLEPESSKWLMYHDFESGKRFGFGSYGNWINDHNANILLGTLVKADINEVEERLKEEAVKRGFKEGVTTKYGKIYEEDFSFKDNNLWMEDKIIMRYGIWAEIVEEKLTLENIQVDCSDLTTEQIEEMKRVVVDNGYKLWDNKIAFRVDDYDNHFYYGGNDFAILTKRNNLTKITYDKFIELFDTKKGEAKSIEELHVEHRDNNSIGKSYSKEDLFLSAEIFNPQSHYNNEFGSLYKMSEQLGLNTYEFDILKRVVRCRKKGQFEEDLQKTKDLIDLYLIESKK